MKRYSQSSAALNALLIFTISLLLTLGFALFTQHAWEDWYITFRASKHLAMGHGLVFSPPEHVHSFTSPIGTLIPAAISYLLGAQHDNAVLWIYAVLSSIILSITSVLLYQLGIKLKLTGAALFLTISLFILDAKTIDFSTNGMETAFLVFFILLQIYVHFITSKNAFIYMGISWAGLMWTRPDGCVYIAAISLAFLVFRPEIPNQHTCSRIALFKTYFKAALLTTLLYGPWFLWAWSYYGSPIPNTITAKGLNIPATPWSHYIKDLVVFVLKGPFAEHPSAWIFAPTYASMGGWHRVVFLVSQIMVWISGFYWLIPFGCRRAKTLSFGTLIILFYFRFLPFVFPWYLPGPALMCIITLGLIMKDLMLFERYAAGKLPGFENLPKALKTLRCAFVGGILIYSFVILILSAYQMRIQQQIIENGLRKDIGLWLHENSDREDTVMLECLGYIGFFSENKMLDHPGLASSEMVEARKRLRTDLWSQLIKELQPNYLVLRPREKKWIEREDPELLQNDYHFLFDRDASAEIDQIKFLPGRDYLRFDQRFYVFKRKD